MKVLFVCRMFDQVAGGVERMAILLMNAMVDRGHDVSLFTWDHPSAQAHYPMREAIVWERLDMGDPSRTAGTTQRVKRMRRFRAFASAARPDVVVAFQHGAFLFAAVSLLRSGIPVVAAERNAPDRLDHTREGKNRRMMFESMRLAAAVTVQFDTYVERYPRFLRERIAVINNPVFRAEAFATPGADRSQRTLLSIGRLSYQKNFSVLVRAFAKLAGQFSDWQLRIVGEGEERTALQQLSESLGIATRVSMPGATRDVSAEYRAADLFCLPSRFEGFPNALAEAMAHGLPVVGFRGCAGMSELVTPGRDGALADGNGGADTLTAALAPLMGDASLRDRVGLEARRIVDRYPPERSFDGWERLLRRIVESA
jgi:GalNAc-alpha-(1->4)-GalNAc-alpha-(1->3)-diNAcBac-PP-undecaprenol alpha-1,4-N-acetyl-D-galactosaminyltransferase